MIKKYSESADSLSRDNDVIPDIRCAGESQITRLYDMYRKEFLGYVMKNHTIGESDAIDIYQDSFLAMYRNIRDGKLTALSCSLKTYLFQIGYHKILKHLKKRKAEGSHYSPDIIREIDTDYQSQDWLDKQEITYHAVLAMPEPCNKVLSLFYWERKSMEEIAGIMQYKNGQVAKNRKLICIKKLKDTLLEKFQSKGLI